MKKILSLFVLALLSSQMWAYTFYVYYGTGCSSSMGTISISGNGKNGSGDGGNISVSLYNVTVTATKNKGYTFLGWKTTNSASAAYVSQEASYTFYGNSSANSKYYAFFEKESKSVTVNRTGSGRTNLALPPGVVDMGLTVGWATKNLGASSETSAGGFYAWGEVSTKSSSYNSSNYTSTASSNNSDLSGASYDAATAAEEGWRIPTKTEWDALNNSTNCTWTYSSNVWTITSKATNNSIKLPFTGWKNSSTSVTGSAGGYYWSSTKFTGTGTNKKPYYFLTTSSAHSVKYDQYCYNGMNIRPVYDPGTTYTLTINVGSNVYTYVCQKDAVIKVSVASESGYTTQWTDGVSTASARSFTMTSNITKSVSYTPTNITISAASAGNGTGQVSTTNGSGYASSVSVTPGTTVYLQATPASSAYEFDYWSNNQNATTISVASTSVSPSVATTYTAHFKEAEIPTTYTITVAVANSCTGMGTVEMVGSGTDLEPNSEKTIRATANIGYRFVRWDDNNTDAERVVTVTSDHDYIAYFEELPLKTTTVAQDGTGSGTYDMVKYSDDYAKLGNIYWATKNVGAETETDKGNYYAWGETTTKSDYQASTYTYTSQNVDENNLLPAAADAATSFAGLGSDWRMPTWSELRDLAFYSQQELTTKSGVNGYAFTRNGQSIFIPLTGYKWETSTYSTSSAIYLWGKQLSSVSYGGYYSPYYLVVYQNGNETFHDVETNARNIGAYEGMPIRPVYVGTVPTIPTCTLTINANNHTYTYIVVNGQQLTVTVNPLEHYRFTGWTKTSGTALSVSDNTFTITGDATYTANFEPITYTITVNSFEGNGKVVITSQGESQEIGKTGGSVTLGENVNVTIQAVPDARNRFISWTCDPVVDTDDVDGASIDIRTLQGDRTFTPTFESNVAMALVDTENEAYYSSLYNDAQYAGKVLTVTMTGRRLAEGSWMTFCAPFDFPIPAGHPMYGSVYRFVNGTMSGTNTEGYISLDFRRTYAIEANVPYLVVAGVTTDSDLEFDGVTIDAEPTQTPVEASSHHVQFVSQPWKSTLTNDALTMEDFYIASGNMLRYANPTTGTTIRAFRAYFHRLVDLGSAPRRMIISLDGVETTKEIGIDGEIEDMTTKRMENGVLYIERNGVRYDAQGQRAE